MRPIDAERLKKNIEAGLIWTKATVIKDGDTVVGPLMDTICSQWIKIIDAEPTVEESEWIPISKRFPVQGLHVLITYEGEVFIARYIGYAWLVDGHESLWSDQVTAWKNLSQPYGKKGR